MGAYLQSLKRFHVSTDFTGERVLADGQKLQHSASAEMDVLRPQMLRVRKVSSRSERELIFDGRRITLFTPAQKYHSTVALAGSLGELTDSLEERYGVELPLSDLFRWGTPSAPTDRIESAMNAGQNIVDHDVCDHYAFRQGGIDWQIWIAAGSRPLPRKIVITNRADEARPQSVSLIDWNVNPTLKDSTFRFTPPAGATSGERERGNGSSRLLRLGQRLPPRRHCCRRHGARRGDLRRRGFDGAQRAARVRPDQLPRHRVPAVRHRLVPATGNSIRSGQRALLAHHDEARSNSRR